MRRQIAGGAVYAADVLLEPPETATGWSVGEVLMSQRHWGLARCKKFLAKSGISESKPISDLTERQRNLLVGELQRWRTRPGNDTGEEGSARSPQPRGPSRVTLPTRNVMSVVMYVKPGCPYCQAAREQLAADGESVEERDATKNAAWKAELMSYTNNRGIVPTIVRDAGDGVQVGFPPGRG